jgi:hypothetical protein
LIDFTIHNMKVSGWWDRSGHASLLLNAFLGSRTEGGWAGGGGGEFRRMMPFRERYVRTYLP